MNDEIDNDEISIEWSQDLMIEIELIDDESFPKIRETLTRIGIPNKREMKLYQSCNILHKKGKYYIVHYKEMFGLDGREVNINTTDISRRNKVIAMLADWNMLKIVDSDNFVYDDDQFVYTIPHRDKHNWDLIPKYNIGVKHF